ncbi:MAG: hypothetical protein CMK59_02640 [Proteobacteria bacterium]|nr:hypothetical protein [Pseudomonadota bacterium]
MLILFIACGDKVTTPAPISTPQSAAENPTKEAEPSAQTPPQPPPKPPQIQNNTEQLVKEGTLQPLPQEHSTKEPLSVQFNTLYPNGCWTQTEAEHKITKPQDTLPGTILHSYTTSYEAEGKMCTMGFKPGGFKTELSLDPGTYSGTILVDGKERTTYSITILAE